jgi:hypothetical protein
MNDTVGTGIPYPDQPDQRGMQIRLSNAGFSLLLNNTEKTYKLRWIRRVDFLASVLLRDGLRARIDLGLALAVRRLIGGGTADARHFDQPLSIRSKPHRKLRILIVLLHGTPGR